MFTRLIYYMPISESNHYDQVDKIMLVDLNQQMPTTGFE